MGSHSSLPPLACFNRVGSLIKTLMTTVGTIGVAALAGYKDIRQPNDSLALATVDFQILTLGISFMLGFYVLCMSKKELTNWQYKLHVALVSFGGVCLMGTNILLLALVNKVYALLALFLVAMLLGIGIAFIRCQINGTNRLPRDQPYEAAMKTLCDEACLIIGGALSMQVAVDFEYYKNPTLHVNQLLSVQISVTFFASVLAVISIMITAMPSELLPPSVRSDELPFLIKFLKYPMLFLTAISALVLGGKFWGWLVLLALIPPILVAIVGLAYRAVLKKNLTRERVGRNPNTVNEDLENPKKDDPDPKDDRVDPEIPAMLTNGTNTCIVLLSAVYALCSTRDENNNGNAYLRAYILVFEVIITSCLSWIAILF